MRTFLRSTVLTATLIAAVAAPAAQASPLGPDSHAIRSLQLRHVTPPPAITVNHTDAVVRERHAALAKLGSPPVHRVAAPKSTSGGFDWTATAIGAGIAGVLLIALGAGALGRTRRLATGH